MSVILFTPTTGFTETDAPRHAMRDAFGLSLMEEARLDGRIVGLSADVNVSTRMHHLQQAFPDRYFEMGISEQNMVGTAAGMALEGLIPFAATYANFIAGRAWEQIRASVCYQNTNVKIIGAHIGFGPAQDGATHQCFEDIALMRCLPNMTVLAPADYHECYQATKAAARHKGPVYMRISRDPEFCVTQPGKPFHIGVMSEMQPGNDVTIIAIGKMVHSALQVAEMLSSQYGITVRVLNAASIKPLDRDAILKATRETNAIITMEEHQVTGGLGSAVAEVVCEAPLLEGRLVPMKICGMQDSFGRSGMAADLYKMYRLDIDSLYQDTLQFLQATKVI